MAELTYREQQLARRGAWAEKNGFHPRAVALAKQTLNIPENMLALVSEYETAVDMETESEEGYKAREAALRAAWDKVIRYVRTSLQPHESDAA